MYYANTLICHPKLVCYQGKQVRNCPPDLLRQFIADKLVYQKGDEGPEESELKDIDVLTHLTRSELIQVCKINNLREFFDPKTSWTDDKIRQAIRDCTENVEALKLPKEESSELSTNPPASSNGPTGS